MTGRSRRGRATNSAYATNRRKVGNRNNSNAPEQQHQAQEQQQPQETGLTGDMAVLIQQRVDQMLADYLSKAQPQAPPIQSTAEVTPTATQPAPSSSGTTSSKGQANKRKNSTDAEPTDLASVQSDADPKELSSKKKKYKRKKAKKQSKRRRRHTSEDESSDTDSDSGKDSSEEDIQSEQEDAPSRQSFGLLVGQTVSDKQAAKIKSGKFVEFADLLPQNYKKKNRVVLTTTTSNEVQLERPTSQKYLWIDQWNEAFLIYMSVYVEKAESAQEAKLLTKELLTYYRDINTLAKQNLGWANYDRQFRKDRAVQRTPISFATIRYDLMLDAQMAKSKDGFANRTQLQRRFRNNTGNRASNTTHQRIPTGYCIQYHLPDRRCYRNPCNYKHVCPTCNLNHPTFMCKGPQQQTTTPPTQQPATVHTRTPQATGGRNTITGPAATRTGN